MVTRRNGFTHRIYISGVHYIVTLLLPLLLHQQIIQSIYCIQYMFGKITPVFDECFKTYRCYNDACTSKITSNISIIYCSERDHKQRRTGA